MNITELEHKTRDELVELAKEMGISNYTSLKKQELIMRLLQANAKQQGYIFCSPAASIRHPLHCVVAAKAGAHIATVPYSVLTQMIHHPLTTIGIARFLEDWQRVSGGGGKK